MADKENTKQLAGAIEIELLEAFDKECARVFGGRFHKKELLRQFAKWWIALPDEEKRRFYSAPDIPSGNGYDNWLIRLIDERIKALKIDNKESLSKATKTADQQVIESIQNIRHFVRYHILSDEASRELQTLRESLGEKPEPKKRSKTA